MLVLTLVLLLLLTLVLFILQLTPKPEFKGDGEGGLGPLLEEAYEDIKVAIDEVKAKFMGKLDVVYKSEDTKLTITVKMMAKEKALEEEKNEAIAENARLNSRLEELALENSELMDKLNLKVSKASNSHSHTTPHLLLHASHTLARASLMHCVQAMDISNAPAAASAASSSSTQMTATEKKAAANAAKAADKAAKAAGKQTAKAE